MADDKTHKGRPDRDRINLSEAYEVDYWTNKLQVTKEALAEAVKHAGSQASDVAAYIKNHR